MTRIVTDLTRGRVGSLITSLLSLDENSFSGAEGTGLEGLSRKPEFSVSKLVSDVIPGLEARIEDFPLSCPGELVNFHSLESTRMKVRVLVDMTPGLPFHSLTSWVGPRTVGARIVRAPGPAHRW